ncbi:zinc finger Ran-binding domain-containing protein 2-like [Acanthaster planci]|uniref:Zinc finger Ran-binding domain-containing protein 2 n=1 Tax=Acanthaster planci TaxID=133434 RepID=A0A8B7ZWS7_ACAPL|nr:zinc finger Ran-binding domain-containing protein 2-like [Acanthaster planci]XP_022109874.1 zinc finger Ran-binding domain-containing protein 2-like [Acanthaster planci]XP_022109875.1 zinc finger Ran-binding domain-containing protein 2-like [Acanthaster planci]
MSRRHSSNEGDWVCSDPKCGNVNFSRRQQCNRCGADKSHITIKAGGSAIGKQLAEKSKGLFSADDWQCKTCGNVNWARRTDCNLCKTPKFGKVEARTGYGGGYNEREGVEYKSGQEDSDGEFDDFGRKKKKFRGTVPPKPAAAEGKEKVEDEEESGDDADLDAYKLDSDDDDDDDDDDGDLSKYDLDGDDDDSAKDAKKLLDASWDRGRSASRSSRASSSSSRSSRSSRSRSSSRSSYSRSRSRSRSGSHDRKYGIQGGSPDPHRGHGDSSSSSSERREGGRRRSPNPHRRRRDSSSSSSERREGGRRRNPNPHRRRRDSSSSERQEGYKRQRHCSRSR